MEKTKAHSFKIDTNYKDDCVYISWKIDIDCDNGKKIHNIQNGRVFNGIYDANQFMNKTFNISVNDI